MYVSEAEKPDGLEGREDHTNPAEGLANEAPSIIVTTLACLELLGRAGRRFWEDLCRVENSISVAGGGGGTAHLVVDDGTDDGAWLEGPQRWP